MSPPNVGDFAEGDDRPDPTARLIAFDFYDGALAGVLEVASERSYRYDLIDEWPNHGEADSVRLFLLCPLPEGSFGRLVELISPHCSPSLPYWIPSWWHLDAAKKAALDAEADAIPATAGPAAWAVAGHFLCGQRLQIRRGTTICNSADEWAALFGLQREPA